MTSTLIRTATVALAGVAAAVALSVPAQAATTGDAATPQRAAVSAAVSPGSVISRTEIIARAQTWVAAQVPYSQNATYNGYRSDCSGYVSMALRTSGSYWTGNLNEIGTPIAFTALQPGDFLNYHNPADPNNGSHVVLFDKWVGGVGGDFWIYEQVKPSTKHRRWSETSGRVLSNYKPMRYVNVKDSTGGGLAAGDVTGDGYADVIGRNASGDLLLYPNNGAGAAAPYGPNTVVGSGWQSFTTIRIADVTGDGKGDVVAVRNDGTLWLYTHSGDNTAPYGTGRQIGTGWAGFTQLTVADVTGDGKADILAAGADGQLRLYTHTGDNTAPYSTGALVGTGWQQFDRVHATDTDNDHHADLLATRPDGTLWLYPHTGDNDHPYDSGTQIGTGWNTFA